METSRKILAVGLLAESDFLSLAFPRKILCAYDINNTRISYDVINEGVEYPIHRPRRQKGFYVAYPIYLDEILEKLGYPEILEDIHISSIMEENFEKIFIETGILKELFDISQERFTEVYLEDNFSKLKDEFQITNKEIKKKEKQNIKGRWRH